jgi:hypothetical protein
MIQGTASFFLHLILFTFFCILFYSLFSLRIQVNVNFFSASYSIHFFLLWFKWHLTIFCILFCSLFFSYGSSDSFLFCIVFYSLFFLIIQVTAYFFSASYSIHLFSSFKWLFTFFCILLFSPFLLWFKRQLPIFCILFYSLASPVTTYYFHSCACVRAYVRMFFLMIQGTAFFLHLILFTFFLFNLHAKKTWLITSS